MLEWFLFALSLSAVAVLTCCCAMCNIIQAITSWGADTTSVAHGSTEQNGNWEVLSGKLHVATADAIITWDAGIDEWHFRFDPYSMAWEIPGAFATDYTKELRFIWNYVDNSNYDYVSLRFTANRTGPGGSPPWADYLASFGYRAAGVDTIELPVPSSPTRATAYSQFYLGSSNGGGRAASGGFTGPEWLEFGYKDGSLRIPCAVNDSCMDKACAGRSWQRTRLNNIVGIGTGPSWTGNCDISQVYITSPDDEASACVGNATPPNECYVVPRPACGCTSSYVAKTVTVTISGTPYTAYQSDFDAGTLFTWKGPTAFDVDMEVTALGVINVYQGANQWQLTNGGVPRSDCDTWTALSIPLLAGAGTCDITGNY